MFFYLQFWTEQKTIDGYIAGSNAAGIIYRWLDLVALHSAEQDFWTVSEAKNAEKGHVKVKGSACGGPWAKLKWFTDLWLSQRYEKLFCE
jgi:hypothetical protein